MLALFHHQFWEGAAAPAPVPVGIARRLRKAKPLVPAAPVYVDVAAASAPALRAALERVLQSRAPTTPPPTVRRRRPSTIDLTDAEEMETVTLMLALLLDD